MSGLLSAIAVHLTPPPLLPLPLEPCIQYHPARSVEGEVMAAAAEDMEAFLATCAASGEAAYGAAKAVLERLYVPATCVEARRLVGAVRRRFAAGGPAAGLDCFRTFHFRIHDVVLDPHLPGPPSFSSRDGIRRTEGALPCQCDEQRPGSPFHSVAC